MFDHDSLKGKKALVVGDLIVDHYRYLKPTRISPEAPVLIYQPEFDEWLPGGASNVANNLMALGVGTVWLASIVGPDWPSVNPYALNPDVRMPELCLVVDPSRQTTVKERLTHTRQQILRIDKQSKKPASSAAANELIALIAPKVSEADVIVFSDYDHGAMTGDLVFQIMDVAKSLGKPIVVDSKSKEMIKYRGATIALPNSAEAQVMTGLAGHDIISVAKHIFHEMGLSAIGLTLGKEGIMLLQPGQDPKMFSPLDPEETVIDVTGAGDTVTSAVAAGFALKMTYDEMLVLANVAAGVVVLKRGVATATVPEILAAAASHGIVL
jgi:rfaE bifunctional protein kinase chain/domain